MMPSLTQHRHQSSYTALSLMFKMYWGVNAGDTASELLTESRLSPDQRTRIHRAPRSAACTPRAAVVGTTRFAP
jgi:hypothetical protein